MIETETNYSKNTPLPRCTKFIVSGVRPSVHVRPSEGRSDVKKTADNDDSFLPYNDLYDAVFDETGTDR